MIDTETRRKAFEELPRSIEGLKIISTVFNSIVSKTNLFITQIFLSCALAAPILPLEGMVLRVRTS